MIGVKYVLAPANAALVNTCFKLPPLANVTPALNAAAPTILAVAALAPNHVPIAGINVGTKIAIAGMIMGAILLTIFLKPFHRSLKKLPNSGRPVSGLIVPLPPRSFSSCASSGVMCARIVSSPRPCCCNCCAKAITDILIILLVE